MKLPQLWTAQPANVTIWGVNHKMKDSLSPSLSLSYSAFKINKCVKKNNNRAATWNSIYLLIHFTSTDIKHMLDTVAGDTGWMR